MTGCDKITTPVESECPTPSYTEQQFAANLGGQGCGFNRDAAGVDIAVLVVLGGSFVEGN